MSLSESLEFLSVGVTVRVMGRGELDEVFGCGEGQVFELGGKLGFSDDDAPFGLCEGPGVGDAVAVGGPALESSIAPRVVDDDGARGGVAAHEDEVTGGGELGGEDDEVARVDGILDEREGRSIVEVSGEAVVLGILLDAPGPGATALRACAVGAPCLSSVGVGLHAVEGDASR